MNRQNAAHKRGISAIVRLDRDSFELDMVYVLWCVLIIPIARSYGVEGSPVKWAGLTGCLDENGSSVV